VLKIPLPSELLASSGNSRNSSTPFSQNLGYYNVTQAGYSYIRWLPVIFTHVQTVLSMQNFSSPDIDILP
jgi:hypothetical protein